MNKFKKILLGVASVLTLGALFTVSSVKIKADGEPGFPYIVDNDERITTENTGTKIDVYTTNDVIASDSNLTMKAAAPKTSYVSKSMGNYSTGIYNSNGGGFSFEAKDAITVTVEFVPCDSGASLKDSSWTFGSVSSSTNALKNQINTASCLIAANSSATLTTGTSRLVIYKVSYATSAKYTLSFNNNGHGDTVADVEDISSVPTLPVLSEEGWRFDGWFYDNNEWENPVTKDDLLSGNTEVYAKWTDLSATWSVNFKKYSSDVTDYAVVVAPKGESVGSENWPTSPRVLNKTFVGWYDGDTEYTSSTPVTADTTLVAKFNELKNDLVVFGDYTTGLSTTATTTPHNFIDGVDASGSTNKKTGSKSYTIGDVAFNGNANSSTFVQCGELTFTLSQTAMVTFYGTQTNDSNAQTTYVINTATNATVMNNFVVSTKVSDTSSLREAFSVTLPAGTYKTVQSGLLNWYGIRVNQDIKAIDTTASVFAEKNAAGDTLRFVGTLTGITSLDDISSVELVLKKGGVASKKQIFLTTCYTSVTGTSQTCAQAENTYYVIYRLNGIKDVTGDFTKKLVITFTDGSTTSSEVTNFSL